jgi:alkylhydroperoxidase family enzyme
MAEQLRARARAKGLTDEQLMELVREAGDGSHADLADAIAAGGYGLFNAVFRRIA